MQYVQFDVGTNYSKEIFILVVILVSEKMAISKIGISTQLQNL